VGATSCVFFFVVVLCFVLFVGFGFFLGLLVGGVGFGFVCFYCIGCFFCFFL